MKSTKRKPETNSNHHLKMYLAAKDEAELSSRVESMLKELDISYDKNNKQDIRQLTYIMCQLLQYPSSEAAELHAQANRLGAYDYGRQFYVESEVPIYKKGKDGSSSDQSVQQYFQDRRKKAGRRCPCCGLIVQPEQVKLKDQILLGFGQDSKTGNMFFRAFFLPIFLLVGMFLIFSIYSIISNYAISKAYQQASGSANSDATTVTYKIPGAFSFGSEQIYSTEFSRTSIIVQEWLGIVTLIIWNIFLLWCTTVERKIQTADFEPVASNYTLLRINMPVQYISQKEKLENQTNQMLNVYYQSESLKQSKRVQAKIQKIVWAIPYNFKIEELPSQKLYEEKRKQVAQLKKKYKEWLKERRGKSQFGVGKIQRQKSYKQYEKLRKQSYQLYQKLIQEHKKALENVKEQKQINHVDAFVTFSFAPSLNYILSAQQKQTNICKKLGMKFCKSTRWASAPEPDEVIWENFGQTICQKYFRSFIGFLITLVILSASFIVLCLISQLQIAMTKSEQNKQSFIISFAISLVFSLTILGINFLIKSLFQQLATNFEKNISYSSQQSSLGRKVLVVLLLNSIAIPFTISIVFKKNIYGIEGLADDVFYFALTNAIVTPILKVLNPSFIWNRVKKCYRHWVCNKWGTTPKQLNLKSEYLPFETGLQYASIMLTFLYTCFFAPLQPIIVLFSAFGLLLGYWATAFAMWNLSKRPKQTSKYVHNQMMRVLYFGGIFYVLGSFLWTDIYAAQVPHSRLVKIFALILSALMCFIPEISHSFRKIWDQIMLPQQQKSTLESMGFEQKIAVYPYENFRWYFSSDYDQSNPSTKFEATNKYNQDLQRKKKEQDKDFITAMKAKYGQNSYTPKPVEPRQIPGLPFDDQYYLKYGDHR